MALHDKALHQILRMCMALAKMLVHFNKGGVMSLWLLVLAGQEASDAWQH